MTQGLPHSVLGLVAVVLLGTIVLGLLRVWRGPDLIDRMLTAQLFGTTGIALLLVLAQLQALPALRNAALILALLAVMATVAFVSRVWRADLQSVQQPPHEGTKKAGEAEEEGES